MVRVGAVHRRVGVALVSGYGPVPSTLSEALARFDSGDPDAPAGGAECRRAAAARARQALGGIAADSGRDRIGVVTHGGVVRSLFPELELANTGFVVVEAAALRAPPETS